MKTLVLELRFLDAGGKEHFRTVEIEAESFTHAIGTVVELIEIYQEENDWDYIMTHLVEIKGDDNGKV